MTQNLWLSCDLGIKGDYEGLYAWLDANGAKDCVGTLAYLPVFKYTRDLLGELRAEIQKAVSVDSRTRVYVIWFTPQKKRLGKFLIGGRISPPWEGYAPSSGDEEAFDE